MFESFFSDKAFQSAEWEGGGGGGILPASYSQSCSTPPRPLGKNRPQIISLLGPYRRRAPTLGLSPANHAQQWRLEFTFSLACKTATKNTRNRDHHFRHIPFQNRRNTKTFIIFVFIYFSWLQVSVKVANLHLSSDPDPALQFFTA